MEPSFSKKRLSSSWKKGLANFLPRYWERQTWTIFLLGYIRFFGFYGTSYKIISLVPKRLIEKLFKKEISFPVERKHFGLFLLLLQRKTDSIEQSITLHKDFWRFFASFKNNSSGPQRSIEKLLKKGYFPREKKLQSFFFFFLILQRKTDFIPIYKSPQGFFDHFCALCKIIASGLKRLIENLFKRRFLSTWRKKI